MTYKRLNVYLNISEGVLNDAGVFNTFVNKDTLLFIDPFLLKHTQIAEFVEARDKIEKYFQSVVALLNVSQYKNDRAWKEAVIRLTFKELSGTYIGYGVNTDAGNAIGPELASRLAKSGKEIINYGILDPEIFEILGLFEEDFGADRLSDMIIRILKNEFYEFTHNVCSKYGIKADMSIRVNRDIFKLPRDPKKKNKPIIFLPKEFLRDLPVAQSFDQIDHVVSTNKQLRQELNTIVGTVFNPRKLTKVQLRDAIMSSPQTIERIVQTYKDNGDRKVRKLYDFVNDPKGQFKWFDDALKITNEYPLDIKIHKEEDINALKEVVKAIIDHFEKLILYNGINKLLYVRGNPRTEEYFQLLFFTVAELYCKNNDLDISPESKASSGPVDFKFSRGTIKITVEVKKSIHSKLVEGYEKQLPIYEVGESAQESIFLVFKVSKSNTSNNNIRKVLELENENKKLEKRTPTIRIVDTTLKPSPSKL